MTEHAVDLVPNLVRRRKSNGRCVYERAAKQALVLRCLQPGVSLAGTALAHGLNANLLRKWVVAYARQNGIPTTIDGRRRAGPALLPVRAVVEPVMLAAASGPMRGSRSWLRAARSGFTAASMRRSCGS